MKRQPLSAKKGEVEFRELLRKQHCHGKVTYKDEYSQTEMLSALKEKNERHLADFKELVDKGIKLSPFLEIGAGYGQTSLLLTNKFKSQGYTIDIASGPLKEIKRLSKKLKLPKTPEVVVSDAENLPFPDNSFPFVFCYQTLHHFPHPAKVIAEIYRVLAPGGYFFFSEEPVRQIFNLRLWNRPTKLRVWEKLLKVTLILPFISKIGKTEIDHGIIEEAFTLSSWNESLSIFEEQETELDPFPFGPKGSLENPNFINQTFIFFLGGGIKGLLKKKGMGRKKLLMPTLVCLNCKKRPSLKKTGKTIYCPNCDYQYAASNNIPVVLLKDLEKKLYPSNR